MKYRFDRALGSFCASAALILAAGVSGTPAYAADISTIKGKPRLASGELASPAAATTKGGRDLYVVALKDLPAIAYDGSISGYEATKPAKGKGLNVGSAKVKKYTGYLKQQQKDVLDSVGGARTAYNYVYSLNGFAAYMTQAQADALKGSGEVVHVWRNEFKQPTTDSTPEYISLTSAGGAWAKGYDGENIVIGSIDTGIWPEHPSFSDQGCQGDGASGGANVNNEGVGCNPATVFGDPPAGWNVPLNAADSCQFGNSGFNALDADFSCNGKLLAARYYVSAFSSPGTADGADLIPSEYLSARDNDGHGSHTASTAGGNARVPASIQGEFLGEVSGMAPRARISSYKICWNGSTPPSGFNFGCGTADATAAIDQAVADGVDVINYSVGGSSTNFTGPDELAYLFAADAGVFVSTSNGNAGPLPQTTGTPSGVPWLISVGNAHDNEVFGPELRVATPAGVAGSYLGLEGTSPVQFADTGIIAGDIVPAVPLDGCTPLTNAAEIAGNIALVIRGVCSFDIKHVTAQTAGAAALVVYNDGTAADRELPIVMGGVANGTIPGMMIANDDGEAINAAAGSDTVSGDVGRLVSLDNMIAVGSSRGPNGGSPDIIKPDVSAPGTQILAAQTPTPNDGQVPGQLFQSISGTSMASPHVAGLGALIKQANPTWSPAMIKSAIMTTARQDLTKSLSDVPADPFDIGAGMIQASPAFKPGLVYDANIFDYVAYLCHEPLQVNPFGSAICGQLDAAGFPQDTSDLNLPSIAIADLIASQTVQRTVTSVAPGQKTYTVHVDAPPGVDVSVNPSTLKLGHGQSATYEVTFSTTTAVPGDWVFGSLSWHGAGATVYSPIAVRPGLIDAPVEISGTGTEGSTSYDVVLGYTGEFATQVHGLDAAVPFPGVVQDDPNNSFSFNEPGLGVHLFNIPPNSAYLRVALFNEDTDGNDDIDLYLYTCTPALSCSFVSSSGNADSNEQVDVVVPVGNGGPWLVFVHGFETDGPSANYTLSVWAPSADAGNMTATGPASATPGPVTIDLEWTGLAPATRYLGAVSYYDSAGPLSLSNTLGVTAVSINTN